MDKLFSIAKENLMKNKGYITAKEIYQQPEVWRKTLQIVKNREDEIKNFIGGVLKKEDVRIIFTGAGTSDYIGRTIAPYLSKVLKKRVEAIATTDIVSSPSDYLQSDVPTIMVSFGRSGNSPESIAAYKLAESLIKDLKQIIITCNKNGELANICKDNKENLLILLPEESNDQGFAMTSSFTSMLLAALLIFEIDNLNNNVCTIEKIIKNAEYILNNEAEEILNIIKLGYNRVVYVGSAALKGLASEASLKTLELTSGKMVSMHESILGFRHGPKSIIDDKTIIFMFVSNDWYTRKYDIDLLKEIYSDKGEHKLIAITYNKDKEVEENADKIFVVNRCDGSVDDIFAAFNYILYAQIFALLYSLELNISPDNPRPDGTVNRVVKGVNIYKFN